PRVGLALALLTERFAFWRGRRRLLGERRLGRRRGRGLRASRSGRRHHRQRDELLRSAMHAHRSVAEAGRPPQLQSDPKHVLARTRRRRGARRCARPRLARGESTYAFADAFAGAVGAWGPRPGLGLELDDRPEVLLERLDERARDLAEEPGALRSHVVRR